MPRLSRNNRVLVLIALMFAASFGVGGMVFYIESTQTAQISAQDAALAEIAGTVGALSGIAHDQQSGLDDYVLSRNPLALRRFEAAVAAETVIEERLALDATRAAEVTSALGAVKASIAAWRANVAAPAIIAVQRGDQVRLDEFASRATEDHGAVEGSLDALSAAVDRAGTALDDQQAAVKGTTTAWTVVAFSVLILAFATALIVVRRFGHALEQESNRASLLNSFTEVAAFAEDDRAIAATNLVALNRLVTPDASVVHILNRSMDRAVPESATGDAIAEVLPLRALDRCAGVVRGTMYVADDLSDDLAVRCSIYPAVRGTLACIPLASGEMVGAAHLYWKQPNALPLDRRPSITRITEHAALAIGNRRLMAALHGQANTDPRTGLANSRAFDVALETALAARTGHETISVLMLDIDHFKQFNDRNGHPAGDEALRVFGAVLQSCMRPSDLAARYGGEEFAVLLSGGDAALAPAIAERIRARTEATIIALAAGVTDRITVSIGIASAPEHGLDRVSLLRLADEALYRAKEGGRNRVVAMTERPVVAPATNASATGPTSEPVVAKITNARRRPLAAAQIKA